MDHAELADSSMQGAAAVEHGRPKAANRSSTSALHSSVRAVTCQAQSSQNAESHTAA